MRKGKRAQSFHSIVGRQKNLDIFCDTFLERAFFLMEGNKYHAAQQCLEQIRPELTACTEYRFVKLNIKFYLYLGQCAEKWVVAQGICICVQWRFSAHSFDDIDKAISSFKRALRLSRLYEHKDHEAEILLNLGKLFARDTSKTGIAKKCYNQAKKIYIDFNDTHRKKMAVFLMGKLLADEITPLYMAMLKASGSRYCAFYNLRQWKNRCRPFWMTLGNEIIKQESNAIYCLLEEENEDPRNEPNFIDLENETFKVEEGDILWFGIEYPLIIRENCYCLLSPSAGQHKTNKTLRPGLHSNPALWNRNSFAVQFQCSP